MPAMNPRTWPRGKRPDFTLPKPNPNPDRMTDALWWLVCMREALEPELSDNGGTYANKAGSHNIGNNLPDYGEGNLRTDHSIRHEWNRAGPWWKTKTAAHDWTFRDAQRGDYRTINKYTRRRIAAMSDPNDLRSDQVVFYTLGNVDGDVKTEGYNELKNGAESSGDDSHAWHIHDSFFRRIVGDFWSMWKSLTIDMGWTYAEWQRSVETEVKVADQFSEEDEAVLKRQAKDGADDLTALSDFEKGGGQGSNVGNGVWGHGYPRRDQGEPRTAAWKNLAAMQKDIDVLGDRTLATAEALERVEAKLDLIILALAPQPPAE
jgi:hypothetical protein